MTEQQGWPAGAAPILNIGDDIGAVLVTFTNPPSDGELRACPRGEPWRHFHTGVHAAGAGDTDDALALFPEVRTGDYSLLSPDGREYSPFTVVGGRVTRLRLEV